jgi:primary-amine oxidase
MNQNNLLLAAALCMLVSTVRAQSQHPLDPLTADEMKRVVQVLKDNQTITGRDYFNIINLREPPKKEVLSYKPGAPFRREAFASFYDYAKPGITEAVVDLNTSKVLSVKSLSNVIGMGLLADDSIANAIVKKDPAWIAALKKRGIAIDSVTHRTFFPGDLGIAPIGHREQMIVPRRKGNDVDIEGLIAYADYTTGKILRIVDEEGRFSAKIDLN